MPDTSRLPVVILISGTGSNMRVIAERAASGELPIDIRAVISDRADARGLATAASMGIPVATLSPKDFPDRQAFDAALAKLINQYQPGLLVLAGFMRILGGEFTAQFSGRALNIHPSLLPKYRGLHTHRRALEAGDANHGVSVHFVTEELDGGPVVIQARVPVLPGDTEAELIARVQRQEHRIYPEVVKWFATGRLVCREGQAWLDGAPLTCPIIREDAIT
ncbi:MAG: phosphoribosylglycinamide formyltransferase [Steroidobacteraceae bacterium]